MRIFSCRCCGRKFAALVLLMLGVLRCLNWMTVPADQSDVIQYDIRIVADSHMPTVAITKPRVDNHTAGRASVLSVRRATSLISSSSDLYTLPRYMSCQLPSSRHVIITQKEEPKTMTVTLCQRFCVDTGTIYAALSDGNTCLCMNAHGTNYLEKDSDCNVTCSGDSSLMCGGKDRWSFYKVEEADGAQGWSLWTSYGWRPAEKKELRVRHRGCVGNKHGKRECLVILQTMAKPKLSEEKRAIQNYFLGCFTHQTWLIKDLDYVVTLSNATKTSMECVVFCQRQNSTYAVSTAHQCLCTTSLGWSRPVDTCINDFGALVFSTNIIKDSQAILKFEARLTQRNVALVAHYRAGSTFASLMFSEHPKALYVFEPASVYHVSWSGKNGSLANEYERTKTFLEKIYPLWFQCESMDLPGIFLVRYPGWGVRNRGLDIFETCKQVAGYRMRWDTSVCSPYIEEKCLMSTVVAAKTTRMIHAGNLRAFTQRAMDVDFIHVFRDPRGTLQSRAQLEEVYQVNQLAHLRIACWELNNLSDLFEHPNRASNLHSLHYEDMATDAIRVARSTYRELGLKLPDEVVAELKHATGSDKDSVRSSVFDVVQQDPKSRINSWTKSLDQVMVAQADSSAECQQFYKRFPSYYKPLNEMALT